VEKRQVVQHDYSETCALLSGLVGNDLHYDTTGLSCKECSVGKHRLLQNMTILCQIYIALCIYAIQSRRPSKSWKKESNM
jgi:hypothetical protein